MPKWRIRRSEDNYILDKEENPEWRILLAEGFGEILKDTIVLNPIEVAYLLFERIATLDPPIPQENLIKIIPTDLTHHFEVYYDLKKRRFLIKLLEKSQKTFLLVYTKSLDIFTSKPDYLVLPIPAERPIDLDTLWIGLKSAKEFDATFTLGIIDDEGNVVYYDVDNRLEYETLLKLRR